MPPTQTGDAEDGELHGLTESQLPGIAISALVFVVVLALAWIYRYKLSGGRLGYEKGRSPHRRCCFWKKKQVDGGLDHLNGHGIFQMDVITLPEKRQGRYSVKGKWAKKHARRV